MKFSFFLLKAPYASSLGAIAQVTDTLARGRLEVVGMRYGVLSRDQARAILYDWRFRKDYEARVEQMLSGHCLAMLLASERGSHDLLEAGADLATLYEGGVLLSQNDEQADALGSCVFPVGAQEPLAREMRPDEAVRRIMIATIAEMSRVWGIEEQNAWETLRQLSTARAS